MEAVVLYDYTAQEPDELTLKKGDVITKIQIIERGWWEGTISKDGKRGLFPDNFVKVISTSQNSENFTTPLAGKKFKVKYNYIPVNVDELELNVNDVVELISEIEEGWWEGKLNNKIGVFPSNFVTEITDSDDVIVEKKTYSSTSLNKQTTQDAIKMEIDEPKSPTQAVVTASDVPELPPKPKPVKEMCIALFPYEAKHEDELTLKENDMIIVLSTELPDKGWWKGQLNGKIGVFPDNFVKLVPVEEEVSKPKRSNVTKTTNKVRDNISKQSNSTVAALRKSLETAAIKLDENIAIENKKPAVLKKPSFTSSSPSDGIKFANTVAQSHKMSPSPDRKFNSSGGSLNDVSPIMKSDLDRKSWVETSLDTRKPRPLSSSLNEKLNAELQESFAAKELDNVDGVSGSKMYRVSSYKDKRINISNVEENGNTEKEIDLNAVERSELLTHPTASRVKAPKRRPPSVINFKDDENNSLDIKEPSSKITINGSADLTNEKSKAPWLQELKLSQVKKNTSQINVKSGFTSTGSNVTFRFQRPVSMFSGDVESQSLTFQTKSAPSASTEPITSSVNIDISSEKVVTISVSDWNTLNEKVNNLEMRMEMQNEYFKKTIEQFKMALLKEIEIRLEMKKEMDKLMDLVTQV